MLRLEFKLISLETKWNHWLKYWTNLRFFDSTPVSLILQDNHMFTQKTGIVVKGSGLSGLYFVWLRELGWNWNSGSPAVSFYRIKPSSNHVFCRLVLSYTKKISKHSLPGPQKIPYLCLRLPLVRKKTTDFSAKTTLSKFNRGNNFIYLLAMPFYMS